MCRGTGRFYRFACLCPNAGDMFVTRKAKPGLQPIFLSVASRMIRFFKPAINTVTVADLVDLMYLHPYGPATAVLGQVSQRVRIVCRSRALLRSAPPGTRPSLDDPPCGDAGRRRSRRRVGACLLGTTLGHADVKVADPVRLELRLGRLVTRDFWQSSSVVARPTAVEH